MGLPRKANSPHLSLPEEFQAEAHRAFLCLCPILGAFLVPGPLRMQERSSVNTLDTELVTGLLLSPAEASGKKMEWLMWETLMGSLDLIFDRRIKAP